MRGYRRRGNKSELILIRPARIMKAGQPADKKLKRREATIFWIPEWQHKRNPTPGDSETDCFPVNKSGKEPKGVTEHSSSIVLVKSGKPDFTGEDRKAFAYNSGSGREIFRTKPTADRET